MQGLIGYIIIGGCVCVAVVAVALLTASVNLIAMMGTLWASGLSGLLFGAGGLSATTILLVFALLATSSLPVLRAIGITVSAGVVLNFFLALMLTRPEAGR